MQQPEAADEAALPTSSPTELQRVFGLAVREEVHCGSCGKATHQAAYEQFFYTTQVQSRAGRGVEGQLAGAHAGT